MQKGRRAMNKEGSSIHLNNNYSTIHINNINGEMPDNEIADGLLYFAKPYMETKGESSSIAVVNPEYKRSVEKYIRYLEDTLDSLGVTVHKDVEGEIFLGSKGDDPSAK